MANKATEPVRPRGRTGTTTLEVEKDLKRDYKTAAAALDTTLRELVEEALRAHWPQIEKRTARSRVRGEATNGIRNRAR